MIYRDFANDIVSKQNICVLDIHRNVLFQGNVMVDYTSPLYNEFKEMEVITYLAKNNELIIQLGE